MSTTITLLLDGTLLSETGEVRLTKTQQALFVAILNRKGNFVTYSALMTEVYRGLDEPDDSIIKVFVSKIRTKLRKIGVPNAIETVWGDGYRWNDAVECVTSDLHFLNLEAGPQLTKRIEDLALASNCSTSVLLNRIVTENVARYEEKVWTC